MPLPAGIQIQNTGKVCGNLLWHEKAHHTHTTGRKRGDKGL